MATPGRPDGPELHVQVLGGFRVRYGDRELDGRRWRRRKALAVLKLLELAPTHALHRDDVLDTLWPDQARAAAANSLHQALHLLRRVLDPAGQAPFIHQRDEIVSLRPSGPLLIDLDRFEAAAAIARTERTQSNYQAALALCPGEVLPDDPYED